LNTHCQHALFPATEPIDHSTAPRAIDAGPSWRSSLLGLVQLFVSAVVPFAEARDAVRAGAHIERPSERHYVHDEAILRGCIGSASDRHGARFRRAAGRRRAACRHGVQLGSSGSRRSPSGETQLAAAPRPPLDRLG
jgi:hypothetical protein